MTFLLNPFMLFGGEIIFQVKTDNPGVSNSTSFLMPLRQTSGTYNYTVEWGDGTVESFTGNTNRTHDYGIAGTYTVRVTGTFTGNFYFDGTNDDTKIIKVLTHTLDLGERLDKVFNGCSNLTELNVSNWDTSNITTFTSFALGCTNLQSLDVSNWDTSNVTNFNSFARSCTSLTTLTVGNAFDNTIATSFQNAFLNCALNQSSVDAILVSFNTAGTSNGTLTISGGTNATPSATGQAATDALRARGWTVTLNGY